MRRNATKVAAAVLSLAVTMTSVNLPTTAAAATKKVKLNKTKATLTVGKSTTLKVTKGGKKVNATFTSSNKKIATVGKKTGKVVAKKKGTCKITAKYAGKKYTCKITVKSKATTPTKAPTVTTAPTAAPTTAPTATPTVAPTATPTAAPAELTIASATAIKATEIQVTLTAPLGEGSDLKITRNGAAPTVERLASDDKKTITFKSTSNYPEGTYKIELTSGANVVKSVDVVIEKQKVAKIEITNKAGTDGKKQALTNKDRNNLYVYYKVSDQYGEDIGSTASVNWSGSVSNIKVDRSKSRLTLEKTDKSEFRYGDPVYVYGASGSVTCNESLSVGLEQTVASVDFKGIVDTKNPNEIITKLPANFAKNRYKLIYQALDQDDKEMEVADYVSSGNTKVIFQVSDPLIIDSPLSIGGTTTVNGKEYCTVDINPGMYVDRGGKITFKATAIMSGSTFDKEYEVEAGQILNSLTIYDPGDITDGDQNKSLSYDARDTKGNAITNYEAIVRSTNKLSLNATKGILKVYQNTDGTAGINWSDSKGTAQFLTNDNDKVTYDDADDIVSISTIVIGGESKYTTLRVRDGRYPTSVNDVTQKVAVSDNIISISLSDGKMTFKDQYNNKLDNSIASAFFVDTADTNSIFKKKYGIRVESNDMTIENNSAECHELGDNKHSAVIKGSNAIKLKGIAEGDKDKTISVAYTVVRGDTIGNKTEWVPVGAKKTITYTIVDMGKLSGFDIKPMNSVRISTSMTEGGGLTLVSASAAAIASDAAVTSDGKRDVTVVCQYAGQEVTIPGKYYKIADTNSVFKLANGKLDLNIKSDKSDFEGTGKIKYGDLYNFNVYGNPRQVAKKTLSVRVFKKDASSATDSDKIEDVKTTVTITDAPKKNSADIKIFGYTISATSPLVLSASSASITFKEILTLQNSDTINSDLKTQKILQAYDDCGVKVSQSDIEAENDKLKQAVQFKVENFVEKKGENTHLLGYSIRGNNSNDASISGVEIGDTFDLTISFDDGASIKVPVKVGADTFANITASPNNNKDNDETLRKALDYAR